MTEPTFAPSTPTVRAVTARLARVGTPSKEGRPRLFTARTRLTLAPLAVVPMTDTQGHPIGTVDHVTVTDRWVYAFGFVYDPDDNLRGMRRNLLIPEFALTNARMQRPVPDEPRTILDGHISAVRAVPNPLTRPAGTCLWTGLRFTVEDTPS